MHLTSIAEQFDKLLHSLKVLKESYFYSVNHKYQDQVFLCS